MESITTVVAVPLPIVFPLLELFLYFELLCCLHRATEDGVVSPAFLGWKKSPGQSARNSRKGSPENVLSRRGLNKGRGKMVIFIMSKHGENDFIRMGSIK